MRVFLEYNYSLCLFSILLTWLGPHSDVATCFSPKMKEILPSSILGPERDLTKDLQWFYQSGILHLDFPFFFPNFLVYVMSYNAFTMKNNIYCENLVDKEKRLLVLLIRK